jgi:hypothetical protein
MAESEETQAAIEYWDRVAASSKRRAAQETVERNLDRAEGKHAAWAAGSSVWVG